MSDSKVSVIIPVYNAGLYLRECLDSVLNQSLRDIEVICVDDGSTDDSLGILQEYAEKDTRVKVLQQQNQYAGVARNNGMASATGEYLLFLDADDFFDTSLCEKVYKTGKNQNADIVLYGADEYDASMAKFSKNSAYFREDLLPDKQVFSRKDVPETFLQITTPCPWTKLFRREFIENEGLKFQPLQNSNDLFFTFVALTIASRIAFVDEELVHYRLGQSTNIQSTKTNKPLLFFEAYRAVYEELVARGVYNEVEKSFVEAAISGCVYNFNTVQSNRARLEICRALQSSSFTEMGLLDHPLEYYRNKNDVKTLNATKRLLEMYEKLNSSKDSSLQLLTDGSSRAESGSPLVSVVVPVYNTASYLEQCLDSLLNQTLAEIEVICVDDGSEDDSLEILKSYAQHDERVIVCSQNNAGQSSARNAGAKIARGDYLYFMDSDDILETEALGLLYNTSKAADLDVIFFDGSRFADKPEILEEANVFNVDFSVYSAYYTRAHTYEGVWRGEDLLAQMVAWNEYRVSPVLQFARRQFFLNNELWFYEGIIYEDNLYTFKCMLSARRAMHVNKVLYKRRMHADSTTTKLVSFKNVYGYFVCFLEMYKFYLAQNIAEDCKEAARSLVDEMLEATRNQYLQIEPEERIVRYALPSEQQWIFKECVKDVCDARTQADTTKARLKKTETQLKQIKNSKTYKVGKGIASLPKKAAKRSKG